MGTGGGIFQLDLISAIAASCSNPAVGAVNMIPDYATIGVNSMTLNLEDSLIYFAPGSTNLSSISLGEKLIVNYTHGSTILDTRSMASYNEYLAVPVEITDDTSNNFGLFVRIRPPATSRAIVAIFGETDARTSHMYMIREEFQPVPGVYVRVYTCSVYIPYSTKLFNIHWRYPKLGTLLYLATSIL